MIDFSRLDYITGEYRRENQMFSYPFIVQCGNGEKVVAWFAYEISGADMEHLFTHIYTVYALDSDGEVYKENVVLDVPFSAGNAPPPMEYGVYNARLEQVYNNFSEDEMNLLIQNGAYKPLFKAFQCVRNYIRASIKKEE